MSIDITSWMYDGGWDDGEYPDDPADTDDRHEVDWDEEDCMDDEGRP